MARRSTLLVLLGALLAAGAACGSTGATDSADPVDPAPEASDSTASDATASDPTTTVDAEGVQPGAPGAAPPTVVLAGDSMMRELSAGLLAALDGPTEASYVATPWIAGNSTVLNEYQQLVAQQPPDLVVVLVGTWEGIRVAQGFRDPGFADQYTEQVRPFVETLTAAGTDVLWLGYPALEGAGEAEQLQAFNFVWSTFPDRLPGVAFLDAGAAVAPGGQFSLTLATPEGGEVLVRQSDGRHLCPEGVVLMARPVIDAVASTFAVQPVAGWEQAPWRADPASLEHPELCPGAF